MHKRSIIIYKKFEQTKNIKFYTSLLNYFLFYLKNKDKSYW